MTLQRVSREEAVRVLERCLTPEVVKEWWITPDSLDYWAWPQVFGSTAGPFGGIGGQAMTTFTIEAWVCGSVAAIFCGGRVLKVVDNWIGPGSIKL